MLVKNPITVSRPISLGTRGPSKVMSAANGTFERSFFAKPFKYDSTTAIASSRDIHLSVFRRTNADSGSQYHSMNEGAETRFITNQWIFSESG